MSKLKKKYTALFIIIVFLFIAAFLIINKADKNNPDIVVEKDSSIVPALSSITDDSLGEQEKNSCNKIILIGIDGADKTEIDNLISQGKLPNLERLIKNGAYGNLKSIKPLLSPIIWTSIATGKTPLEHGITDFLTVEKKTGKEIPVSSNLRKVKALWNIFTDYEKKAGVVGWLVTWPAEKINGYVISDHVTYLDYDPHINAIQSEQGLVYPDSILKKVKSFLVAPQAISFKKISEFLDINKNNFEEAVSKKKGTLFNAASVIASTETIKNISIYLYKNSKVDLFSVYFKGIDSFSHLFANDSRKSNPYKNPITQFYIYQDSLLGEILKLTDQFITIFIVSDHGFKLRENLPAGSSQIGRGEAVNWHNDNGIIIIAGNNIKKGVKINEASVLDVTPTILHLAGLPIADDMDGKILKEAIDPAYLNSPDPIGLKSVTSHEDINKKKWNNEPISSRSNRDAVIKSELESLGYLYTGTANSYNNIGNLYMNQGKYKLAVKSFEKAVELEPNIAAFYDNLGSAYKELKMYYEAIEAHKKAISLDPRSAKTYNNLGRVYSEKEEYQLALQNYEKAIELDPSLAEGYNNIGELYYKQGKIENAISLIKKSIEKDNDFPLAHYNLAVILGEKNEHINAINQFEKVLKIDPSFYLRGNVYNGIGVAYFKLENYDKALENFNKVLEIDSAFTEIHMRLGIVNIMLGMKDEGITELKNELAVNPENKELINLINKLEKEEAVKKPHP